MLVHLQDKTDIFISGFIRVHLRLSRVQFFFSRRQDPPRQANAFRVSLRLFRSASFTSLSTTFPCGSRPPQQTVRLQKNQIYSAFLSGYLGLLLFPFQALEYDLFILSINKIVHLQEKHYALLYRTNRCIPRFSLVVSTCFFSFSVSQSGPPRGRKTGLLLRRRADKEVLQPRLLDI